MTDHRIFAVAQLIIGATSQGMHLTTGELLRRRGIEEMAARHFNKKRPPAPGQSAGGRVDDSEAANHRKATEPPRKESIL